MSLFNVDGKVHDYAKMYLSFYLTDLGNFKKKLGVKSLNGRKQSSLRSFFRPIL